MKQKLILIITLLLALACAAVPAVADSSSSAPLLPMQFFGTASYENGDAVPAGFSIVAELGGQTFTYTLTEDGIFGGPGTFGEKFIVEGDSAWETITFSLVDTAGESISAFETVLYEPGEVSEISLTFANSGVEVIEYGAWLSADTVALGDVFFMNITGNPNGTARVNFNSASFSVIPNQVTVNSSGTGYVYFDLGANGKQTVAFKADGACVTSFSVELSGLGWYYPEITVTGPEAGYLRIDAPKGLSLDIESEWVYAHYYDAYGNGKQEYITWKIDDKSVIGLSDMEDRSIRLTPRSVGTAVLYAELSDNPLVNASVEIVVEETEIIAVVGNCDDYISLGTTIDAWGYAVDQFGNQFPSEDLQWSVSGGNISLTRDSNDNHRVIVTPIYVGEETITLRSISTGLSWSKTITVTTGKTNPNAGDPDHLWCWIENPSLTVDAEPGHAHAYVDDEYGNTLYEELMEWEIDNESVAVISVDNDINDATHSITITPKSPGVTTLTVYAKNYPELNATWHILVEDTVVSSVSGPYFPEKISLSDSGHTSWVYVYDQFGNQIPDEYATVTVSDKSVLQLRSQSSTGSMLQVQNDHYVSTHPVSTGTVTITTSAVSNASAVCNTTVTVEDSEVALISLEDHNNGITTQSHPSFYAEVQDYYGNYLHHQNLVWTIGNKSVLLISDEWDNSITCQPLAPGTTTIRVALASDRTIYDEITVTVEESILSSVKMGGRLEMSTLSSGHAYAYVCDQYGAELREEEISWSVDNPNIVDIEEYGSSYNRNVDLLPKAVGSTTLRAYSVSDPSLTWNQTVTVYNPEITEFRLSYPSKVLSMNSLGYVSAKMMDQFGMYCQDAELFWTVDNASVLELSSSLSKTGHNLILIPRMPGVVNLTVSPMVYPQYSETVQITVADEPASYEYQIETAGSYPLGSPIHLSGNVTSYDPIWFYIEGMNIPLTELSYHGSGVSADGTWEITLTNSELEVDLDIGTYIIYAVSGGLDLRDENPFAGKQYGKAVITFTEPIVSVDVPEAVLCGTDVLINGTTVKPTSAIQAYVFGTNLYQKLPVVIPDDTGSFLINISTAEWAAGQYYLLVHHPMEDGNFNIDITNSGDVYLNTAGPAVVNGVGVGDILFDIYNRHPANAANAFIDAIYYQDVDDWCILTSFTADTFGLDMNVVKEVAVGTPLVVSGTSLHPEGTVVTIEMISTTFAAVPKEEIPSEAYRKAISTISAEGTWNTVINTTGLYVDEYRVTASVSDGSAVSVIVNVGSTPSTPDEFIEIRGSGVVALESTGTVYLYSWSGDNDLGFVWSVDNESVLYLTGNSNYQKNIVPVSEGTANITVAFADDSSVYDVLTVTVVSEISITGIEIESKGLALTTASQSNLYVQTLDQSNGYMQWDDIESFLRMVSVTSSNTSVVTVSPSEYPGEFTITPVSVGEAIIYANSTVDATITAAVLVTVEEPKLSLTIQADEGLTAGSESYITAWVSDQNDMLVAGDTDDFIWNVSNSDLLRLEKADSTNEMIMIGLAPGMVNITVTWKEDPSCTAYYTINVEKAEHNYISAWGHTRLTTATEDAYMYAELRDQYGHHIISEQVAVTIVNTSVISLTPDPEDSTRYLITPLAVGTTEIVFSVKDSAVDPRVLTVKVDEVRPQVYAYLYSGDYLSLSAESFIIAEVTDQHGNQLNTTKYPLIWNVSNSSVLDVTENTYDGNVILKLTPLTEGTSIIAASLATGEISEPIEIRVKGETKVSALAVGIIGEIADISRYAVYGADGVSTPMSAYKQYVGEKLTMGDAYDAGVIVQDQYGNFIDTDAVKLTVDDPKLLHWIESENDDLLGPYPYYPFIIVPQQAGTVTLTATSTVDPSVSDSITFDISGNGTAPIIPEGEAEVIVPPVISPAGGTIYQDTEITITTETNGASVYYTLDGTTPTNNSILYEKPFTLDESSFTNGKSLVIKAVAVKDGCEDSTVVTEIYTHAKKDKPKHKVQAQTVTGGSVTLSTTESEADELISITFKADEGYTLAGWSIQGSISGSYSNKSGSVSDFSMWDEDVIIVPDYVKIIDNSPKPAAIKFQHVPSKIYENDTGALNAIVYDQFGERFANNKVTWSSSAPSVFTIDETTGVYHAKAGGIAVVTATSTDNPDVSASLTLSVYVPPKPLITGEISGPSTAYYGVMSDPYIVTSEYASHLNWDFGDGTPTVKTEVNYPYPYYTSSYDTVSHTFVETGDLTVELTPSNSYREGETKTFSVHVTYAPPRNLVITDGPTAVVGGESYVYTAFATNADTYTWYLDGQVVEGQTNSVATITFPISQSERTAEVKVAASYKDSGNCEPVTKTVTVSVAGGELGEFGDDITMTPAKPAVGDVVVFSIDKVSNAVKYVWTFEDGYTETTTAPKVSHALKDTETDSVKVTAYNSADLTKEKTYTFTAAGAKPAKPEITASKTPATAGDTITFTAASNGAKTYKWVVDGVVQESTSNTCEVFWTVDDVGKHEIAVTVSNDYGTAKKSIGYEVIAKKGKPAVIKKITGPDVMNEKGSETFNAVISCSDDYTIAWYLNNELLEGETSKHLKLDLKAGNYVLKVVVTTEYEEVSTLDKYFKVVSKNDKQKNNKDKSLEAPENAVTPQMVDNSSSGKSAFSTIGSLTLDKDDISQDADEVSIEIAPINPEELAGFTDEMGSRQNVLMSLEINPTGLKNEKDLSKSAVITFRLLKDDIADHEAIQFYRLDTGSGIDQWVRLNKVDCTEDGDYYVFTVETAGMSQFVAAPVSLSEEQETPSVPTVEVKNTTETFNAKTAAEVSYTLAPENIGTITAPVLAKGGLQLMIDNVVVEKIAGGSSTKVSAEVLANGAVSVSGDISDAESLKVSFIGRVLGDTLGNGKVGAVSALKIAQNIVGLDSGKMSDTDKFYGDVNGDGSIKVVDALMIAQYTVGILDENYIRVA